MDSSLFILTDALKKLIWNLNPKQNPLSFLLLIGRENQGKSALLKQSSLEQLSLETEHPIEIYYNSRGIILELNEAWLHQCHILLDYILKQLNQCHKTVRISGLLLAIDINTLIHESHEMTEQVKPHAQLLQRFCKALGYPVDINILFTKLDSLAGFCDFFQQDTLDRKKPLGFSLDWVLTRGQLAHNYRLRFEQLIEGLGQDVIDKIHPARSSQKRTIIREFPLQLASLRLAIQALLQQVPSKPSRIQSIYFTSAEQGGVSMDHLNKKIQHEYGLNVPNKFYQSNNYRPYFIEAALENIQKETQRHTPRTVRFYQWGITAIGSLMGLSLAFIIHHHLTTTHVLDQVTKDLLTFDALSIQKDNNSLYHMAQASKHLEKLSNNFLTSPAIEELKITLQTHANHHLIDDFLPSIRETLEHAMISSQTTPIERYHMLKIYLMLNDSNHRNTQEILDWFKTAWKKNNPDQPVQDRLALLQSILQDKAIPINEKTVREVRNYLNALPVGYLYYALAKETFSSEKIPLRLDGFRFKQNDIPFYFTKEGFHQIIKTLPKVVEKFESDNWILSRQDLATLPQQLKQAYCFDYVLWWQHFMRDTTLNTVKNYEEAKNLTEILMQSKSIEKLLQQIQTETGPDTQHHATLFNQEIAVHFSSLNFISHSAIRDLSRTIQELHQFYSTLAVVHDGGQAAFALTKTRFQDENQSNPLSALYTQTKQLPEPVSNWIKHLADDTWFLLLNDSKQFINAQWEKSVFQFYEQSIANRYPFDTAQTEEITLIDFDRFFSRQGILNQFVETYLRPFLDTSHAEWKLKERDGYVLPISSTMLNELIRANVITAMFFPQDKTNSMIAFSLQKINLDPVVSSFKLAIGQTLLQDSQMSDTVKHFSWPSSNATLVLHSVDGNDYELTEEGPWAFFKMLQKVNVLVDENDSSSLEILFEINGNSGRYLLKTENDVNPFTPGILNGFVLTKTLTS